MGTIFGQVIDKNKKKIENAKIRIIEGTASFPEIIALTDSDGKYDIDYVDSGNFIVEAEKEGYEIQKKRVFVNQNEEKKLNFTME